MASTGPSRINGIDPSVAVKAPCDVATTANITLSGAQTIDGVAVAETTPKTRVLVKNQANATENGIYDVYDTAWARSKDCNGARDIVDGTQVAISSGTAYAGSTWRFDVTDPVSFGTSSISLTRVSYIDESVYIPPSRNVDLLSDIASLDLADYDEVRVSGESAAGDNIFSLQRSSGLDSAGKAGSAAEISSTGKLVAYDVTGKAFVEVKQRFPGRTRSNGRLAGRNVHIYEWGSPYGGNDWCFVRTPDGYDPQGEPHPLLILNHGNGWIMDGTEATANFSSKTQFGVDTQNSGTYLDDTRSDYVEYSSPMIEAFLAAGYVVCGAQNDGQNYGVGQAGYGNRETRQNIKLFFDHIQTNYNVQPWCHMIGASNGCIATLNAAMIMGSERIRSITLLYPLINLHAAWSSTYTSAVETAYSPFSTSGAFSSFLEQTDGHDPMVAFTDFSILAADSTEAVYANANFYRLSQDSGTKDLTWVRENRLVDSAIASDTGISLSSLTIYRRSIFPWPRIRCHWSPDDTAVPQEYHWQAFEKLLTRGNHVTFSEEVLGEHGDYRHFEGLDGSGVSRIIAWTQI